MRHIVMALLGLALVLCASSDGTEPFQQPHSCGIVLRSDTEQVLDGIIYDVLYNPTFQEMRQEYGTVGDREIAFVTCPGYGIPWPGDYVPDVGGYLFKHMTEGAFDRSGRRCSAFG